MVLLSLALDKSTERQRQAAEAKKEEGGLAALYRRVLLQYARPVFRFKHAELGLA